MGRIILDSDDEGFEDPPADNEPAPVPKNLALIPDITRGTREDPLLGVDVRGTKRPRDDLSLGSKTCSGKVKLRRVSSAGTPSMLKNDHGSSEEHSTLSPGQYANQSRTNNTQGNDTEWASSATPTNRRKIGLQYHNTRGKCPGSPIFMSTTQHTSFLTFPSLSCSRDDNASALNDGETQSPSVQSERCARILTPGNEADGVGQDDANITSTPSPRHRLKIAYGIEPESLLHSPDELAQSNMGHSETHVEREEKTSPSPTRSHHTEGRLSSPEEVSQPRQEAIQTNESGGPDKIIEVDPDQAVVPVANLKNDKDVQGLEQSSSVARTSSRSKKRGRPSLSKKESGITDLPGESSDKVPTAELEDMETEGSHDMGAPAIEAVDEKPPAGKKRRGRPKKDRQLDGTASHDKGKCEVDGDRDQAEQDKDGVEQLRTVKQDGAGLNEADGGMGETPRKTPEQEDHHIAHNNEADGDFVEVKPMATPTKPMPSPQKAPNHSPLNKGRVPFKVGLSRRARIEPLLRVVKK